MIKKAIFLGLIGLIFLPFLIEAASAEDPFSLPLIGAIDTESASMLFTTVAVGFVDGLNPYSLWGLVFLLGIVTAAGSRRKAMIVGFTYLAVVGLVYGLMMAGFLSLFSQWDYQGFIRIAVGLIAAAFASLNIYDYFKRKTEATIVTRRKQSRLKQRILRVMNPRNGIGTLISGTAVVALGITILEFPLTFSLPMVWANIIARYEVAFPLFLLLLLVYLLVYLIDEIIVFLSIVFALNKLKISQNKEQALKLIGGMVIMALALGLILDLEALNTLTGSLILFGSALAASLVVMVLYPPKSKKIEE